MTMDREKEREIELESAMYTNCLLLGLDPSILGGTGGRVGLFRHSNPKLGEQLLYFILSSLRGPIQSAKDFDKVWPIFDSAQSRDFRKVVQGIINELESQGALPRSNSRVSSLATCCGPRVVVDMLLHILFVSNYDKHNWFVLKPGRVIPLADYVIESYPWFWKGFGCLCWRLLQFVELLWQLSLHALREVHRRTFPGDVASNPLPASLTDVAFSHAATLLPVTKARIALERRKFLKNADTAVRRQAMWSNLAHEMTAEFRGLCAEEAYLQQELEKLQDLRNKAKMDGELWDDRVSSSSGQNSHLVSKATRLWESLLARKSQHEVLASGPIEDLIAHREHRYRISGSALLSAMDQSSQIPYTDVLSIQPGNMASTQADDREPTDSSFINANREKHHSSDTTHLQVSDDILSRVDDRSGRVHPTVDIAEVLRRWTHALQRIHKQSLQLAKANNGEGPELLRSAHDAGTSGHAESLASVLAEHRQHLASIQVLINQLKDSAPALEKSISELTAEVNTISSTLPPMAKYQGRSTSPIQAQSSGRTAETGIDEVSEVTSKLSTVQLEKVSASPALKLPQLFSLTPNSSGKGSNTQKRHTAILQVNPVESVAEGKSVDLPISNNNVDNPPQGSDSSYVHNLRRSVREAALSLQSCDMDSSRDNHSYDGSEHFFVPFAGTGLSGASPTKVLGIKSKRLFQSPDDTCLLQNSASDGPPRGNYDEIGSMLTDMDSLPKYTSPDNGFRSVRGSKYAASDAEGSVYGMNEALDQVFSPPLLMDTSLMEDSYEDLLAPLSETDTALMEC
ncbi:hypothetical protein IFM89_006427 [Coptis chinensis]|uniref:HAUS augmin-like complex subunit 6 N-terminal domain-containing protein n=1 Tax=Coptis chinensis TaxID=261450 RepID=A0A835LQK5_9MAGN|nr:hypothetical protein IFM89_006427 [Coptis chinensis]